MAKHIHIAIGFFVVTLFFITFPLFTVADENNNESISKENKDDDDDYDEKGEITKKYGFLWTRSSSGAQLRYDFSNFNDDIDSVDCISDINCTAALPGVEDAILYDSDIASSPYCVLPIDSPNVTTDHPSYKCTCGVDRCVSYSRNSKTNEPFYYCGPCGYVGSKCTTHCDHDLAECRGSEQSRYCECIEGGIFYDMAYCYIPFYGQDIIVNVIIATTILLLCCGTLAYGYHKLGGHRYRHGSFAGERGNNAGRRESPPDDTPPAYDEVIGEKLPSYQDAIKMVEKNDAERGVCNPVFQEEDEVSTKQLNTEQDSTATSAATQQLGAENQDNNNPKTMSTTQAPPSYTEISITSEASNSHTLSSASSEESVTTASAMAQDIASFPESQPEGQDDSGATSIDNQHGSDTQPIQLALHIALRNQKNTTTL